MPGTLYIVATPVGNLNDLSPRIKATFEKVDLILAEDTRVTIKLLNHLGIKKRMISCHEFNEKSRLGILTEFSKLNQSVALVSDAGTPLISDPGNDIVQQAISCDMTIIPIPGPNAALLALVASGLPCDRFVFEGFLPSKANLLKARLAQLEPEQRTIILYEAPHRLLKTLRALNETFGDRNICIARELTKIHEEFVRNKISKIINRLTDTKLLGEYVIVIAGNDEDQPSLLSNKSEIENAVKEMLKNGATVKTIVQTITEKYKVKRSEIYQLALSSQKALTLESNQANN
jgi:16S rRNA (cytidine1402-2'-O)-methyltransferase